MTGRFAWSVLDLSPVGEGFTPGEALRNTTDLARQAEKWGYTRFWVAEHHSMPGIASAATAVVLAHVAAHTSHIRVGSGGIMLPNHAPLVVAEQFGTLESLHPGRIDLGLGRAPGTDQVTARALRRNRDSSGDTFPQDLAELLAWFQPAGPGQSVRAVPGEGMSVPIWLLGSSTFSARLAAELGFPFAFASHFAPEQMFDALEIYRSSFRPSPSLEKPYVMIGVNVIAADSEEEARRQFTSVQQAFVSLARGMPGKLPRPVDSMEGRWLPHEQDYVERTTRVSAIGTPEQVRQALEKILRATGADEIIATAHLHDHAARLHSFELAAGVFKQLSSSGAGSQ